jgi:transcriptional regulator with XRE-family HTH domain
MARFHEELRRAIRDSGMTRYEISAKTGIYQSTLSEFVNGKRGLGPKSIDKLLDCLQLEFKLRRKSTKRKDG